MVRTNNAIASLLIYLGSLFTVLSVAGIIAIWVYREPLIDQTTARLNQVDTELTQAHTALNNGKDELQRTLRIVDAADKGLSAMKQQMSTAKQLTDKINGTVTGSLIPGLQGVRSKVDQLRGMLENLRNSLKTLNSIPFLNLNLPGDQFLAGLISDVDNLDKEIASVQQLAQQASTFVGDTDYLLGGNLTDTKMRIQDLLNTVTLYDQKVGGWQAQERGIRASAPRWINESAVGLTLFLIWFGISQFGLVLHGLAMRQGYDPLAVLRRNKKTDYDQFVD